MHKIILPNWSALLSQEKVNWCWAACAQNVLVCSGTTTTQCWLAAQCLSSCGSQCKGKGCDVPYFLHVPLQKVGKFSQHHLGSVSDRVIQSEIDSGRAVGLRIAWAGGADGHFVIIIGYGIASGKTIEFYLIFDPAKNRGLVSITARKIRESNGYFVSGTWSETILTL